MSVVYLLMLEKVLLAKLLSGRGIINLEDEKMREIIPSLVVLYYERPYDVK